MTESRDDRPEWWETNSEIKRELGLPAYEPPTFEDGRYVHEVVDPLESRWDCSIQFAVVNPSYPDTWHVWIDGERAFAVGRYRTVDANTVYEMTADEFRSAVGSYLRDDDSEGSDGTN